MAAPQKLAPYPYQIEGAKWLAERETAILADQMGVGKSFTSIHAADLVKAKTILIICPGIARYNWQNELNQCQRIERISGLIFSPKAMPMTDVIITSYNMIRQPKVFKYLISREWDVIIFDEAHYLKNPKALQTKCAYGEKCTRGGLTKKGKRVWLLSGTIMPNDPSELWSHCNALFPSLTKGKNYYQWIGKYCIKRYGSDSIVGANKGAMAELAKEFKPFALRRRSEDVLKDLPTLTTGRVTVQPNKLPIKTLDIEETELVVRAALEKIEKGRTEEGMAALKAIDEAHLTSLRRWTGLAKAPAIAEFINEEFQNGLDKIVVFAIHRDVIHILLSMIPNSVAIHGGVSPLKQEQMINGFQKKIPGYNPKCIIVQLSMGSTAITLTAACQVAFAEYSFVPKDLEQAWKRVHRNGQTRPVTARVFYLNGSVDEQLSRIVMRKAKDLSSFNNAISS